MRKLLLTTVALAALTGYAGIASARPCKSATVAGAGAAAKRKMPNSAELKGALSGATKGRAGQATRKMSARRRLKAAEEASPAAKPDQRLGQDQPKSMTRQGNAEEEKPGATTQKTGEENSGAEQRGAQEDKPKTNQIGQNPPGKTQAKRPTTWLSEVVADATHQDQVDRGKER